MADPMLYKWFGGVLASIVVSCLIVALVVLLVRKSEDNNDSSDSTGSRVTDSLKFLVFISKHGNRGAHADYPNDPYPLDDLEYWPYGIDRLTPQGRVQMYNLGVRVRSLYDGFLNSTFHPEEIHASSTYVDRMLMSGEAFLAGLYPPEGWQLWDTTIPWQPTPVYSDSPDKTAVLDGCPKYLENYLTTGKAFLKTYASNISSLVDTYAQITGTNVTGLDGANDLWCLWDKLISEDTEGYTVPDWAKALYPDPLENLVALQYVYTFGGNEEIIRLVIGELYDEILETLESVVNSTQTERKVQYYSGHDSTIVALQVLLGVFAHSTVDIVKAGSGLALELHLNQTTDQFYLQVLYIDGGTTDLDLTVLKTPTCGDPCFFSALLNNTRQYTNVNYDQECSTSSSVHSDQHLFPFYLWA